MAWINPAIRNSISAMLGAELRTCPAEALNLIRQAMLDLLGEEGARLDPGLARRIAGMQDALSLWYARSEVVRVLSPIQGESRAVAAVHELLPVFRDVLPKSMTEPRRPPR